MTLLDGLHADGDGHAVRQHVEHRGTLAGLLDELPQFFLRRVALDPEVDRIRSYPLRTSSESPRMAEEIDVAARPWTSPWSA